jgi:DNA-binding MarR family transcriptional regulator
VDDDQTLALTQAVAALIHQFKLTPGLLAGSAYADLHANDAGLLSLLHETGPMTVRGLAQSLSAPDSTVSSALDRLEQRNLLTRRRQEQDRRIMVVALTEEGQALTQRIVEVHLDNSRSMLARLSAKDRVDLIRLVSAIANPAGD